MRSSMSWVPSFYTFPNVAKVLSLSFVPFAAWLIAAEAGRPSWLAPPSDHGVERRAIRMG